MPRSTALYAKASPDRVLIVLPAAEGCSPRLRIADHADRSAGRRMTAARTPDVVMTTAVITPPAPPVLTPSRSTRRPTKVRAARPVAGASASRSPRAPAPRRAAQPAPESEITAIEDAHHASKADGDGRSGMTG